MAVTEYASVLNGTGNVSKSAFINMMEQRGIYVIEDGETPTDLTPGFATHLAYRGVVFWYDSADATTAHDGTTCIVTADGKRFKSDGFAGAQTRFFKITDKDLAAPPGSPTVGDSYIVATGGSGAWATHDKHVATYTARGWMFTVPGAYDLAGVTDESMVYHYSAGGAWTSGFPFFTIGADTVLPSALKYGRFGLSVVNQTTNAPPGSPSDGDAYVIGGSPTGAWTGAARSIAIYQSSGWVIYTPYDGATVYDKGTDTQIKYDGSSWVAQSSGYATVTDGTEVTSVVTVSGTYSFSATAPTTSNTTLIASHAVTPRKTGAVYEIDVILRSMSIDVSGAIAGESGVMQSVIALFDGSAVNASDWMPGPHMTWADADTGGSDPVVGGVVRLRWTAPDTSAHTLNVRASRSNKNFNGSASLSLDANYIAITARERS